MDQFKLTAAEVEAVIAEIDGDLRAAIAALLHDRRCWTPWCQRDPDRGSLLACGRTRCPLPDLFAFDTEAKPAKRG